jgi:hypothetical protein
MWYRGDLKDKEGIHGLSDEWARVTNIGSEIRVKEVG